MNKKINLIYFYILEINQSKINVFHTQDQRAKEKEK